ncbi:MAG: ankyrin repeat domain-containing protein, partial [Pyramidobacter sp.]|nr:ankyrin repeat domain-containing protein [Pyramidobacter sp.]
GADVTARTTGRYQDTVLHSAIWTKDPRVIALLLERGADPYALDTRQWTPMRLAAYHMRGAEILGLLVQGMHPVEPTPGKRYKGPIEYVDSWNRRAYQLVDGQIIEHNLRRVGRGIFLGHLVVIQYHVSAKSKASVENLTLKEADAAHPLADARQPK